MWRTEAPVRALSKTSLPAEIAKIILYLYKLVFKYRIYIIFCWWSTWWSWRWPAWWWWPCRHVWWRRELSWTVTTAHPKLGPHRLLDHSVHHVAILLLYTETKHNLRLVNFIFIPLTILGCFVTPYFYILCYQITCVHIQVTLRSDLSTFCSFLYHHYNSWTYHSWSFMITTTTTSKLRKNQDHPLK